VLLHPHPLIDTLFHRLPVQTVRFDFPSAVPSHARGAAEGALDALGDTRAVMVGYSFGADIAASLATAQIASWVLIAPPMRVLPPGDMAAAEDPRPKLVLVAEADRYCPPVRVREVASAWPNTRIEQVAGADHFLVRREGEVLASVRDWLTTHF
jgi:pimeloyl-ACP methyl ester carboxylesterase